MRIKQLIEKGLIKKTQGDCKKSEQSIKVVRSKLEESVKAFEAGIYEASIVFSYMSMFHAARAIMYRDGYNPSLTVC